MQVRRGRVTLPGSGRGQLQKAVCESVRGALWTACKVLVHKLQLIARKLAVGTLALPPPALGELSLSSTPFRCHGPPSASHPDWDDRWFDLSEASTKFNEFPRPALRQLDMAQQAEYWAELKC